MKCEICDMREAFITMNFFRPGISNSLWICLSCMQKYTPLWQDLDDEKRNHIFQHIHRAMQPRDEIIPICPVCGRSLKEFEQSASAGCAECYNVFAESVSEALAGINCHLPYTGDLPLSAREVQSSVSEKREYLSLMKKAAEEHNYEEAAALRNKLKDMVR